MKRCYFIERVWLSIRFVIVLLLGLLFYCQAYSVTVSARFDARPYINSGNTTFQHAGNRAEQFCREYTQSTYAYPNLPSSYASLSSLPILSKEGYETYFAHYPYAAQELLHHISHYKNDGYIAYLKTLPDYEKTIDFFYNKYVGAFCLKKFAGIVRGKYYRGFARKLIQLKREVEVNREQRRKYEGYNAAEKINHHLTTAKSYTAGIYECSRVAYTTLQKHNYDEGPAFAMVANALESLKEQRLSEEQIIFNLSVVNRIVSDIERTSNSSITASRLLDASVQGLTTFMKEVNPETQIIGSIKGLVVLAHLVADVTVGKVYLPPAVYQERTNQFLDVISRCSLHNISQATLEDGAKALGSMAAASVFFAGLSPAFRFLRFINALQITKLCHVNARRCVTCFKNALTQEYAKAGCIVKPNGTVALFAPEKPLLLTSARNMTPQALGCPKRQLLLDTEKYMLYEAEQVTACLRPKYDLTRKGFLECSRQYIKLPYNHIFRIELRPTKRGGYRVSGFHFDEMNALENTGIIEFRNRYQDAHGFYKAELYWDGNKVKELSSFFPAHWTHEDVVKAIIEAYDDFIKKGATKVTTRKDCYVIEGETSTGHTIEMIITLKGKMKTAYPLVGVK